MKRQSWLIGSFHVACLVLASILLYRIIYSRWLLNRGNINLVCVLIMRDKYGFSTSHQALDLYWHALSIDPEQDNVAYSLGVLYRALGDSQSAFEMFSESNKPLSSYELGQYHYQRDEVDLAIAEWRKAGYEQKLLSDGARAFSLGNYKEALTNLELAIKIRPAVLPYYYELLVKLYLRDGRETDAFDAWTMAYPTGAPDSFQQTYLLGQIRQQQGDYLRADESFGHAVELFVPSKSELQCVSLFVDIGNSYRALREFDRAEIWYERAPAIGPEGQLMVLLGQGVNFLYQRRYDNAIDALTQAVTISPNDAKARYFLGVSYTWKCQYFSAAIELEQAVQLQPDNGLYHYELGVVYQNMSQYDLADKEMRLAAVTGSLDTWRTNSLVMDCK